MTYVLGIDLGTSNSCAAIADRHGVRMLPINAQGGVILPSVVTARPDGRWVVGSEARTYMYRAPRHTYVSTKRIIGRQFEDEIVERQRATVQYEIEAAENGEAWVRGPQQLHSPVDVAAMILRKIREAAKRQTGKEVTKCVVAVPAMFDDRQLAATKAAAEAAGLEVLRVIREPTAAAIAHDVDDRDKTIAVFDLGGGTFDVTILQVCTAPGEDEGRWNVVCSHGDPWLGGDDFDAAIINHLVETVGPWIVTDRYSGRPDPTKRGRLWQVVESVKRELSWETQKRLFLSNHGFDNSGKSLSVDVTLTRETVEQLCLALAERTLGPCREALADAGLNTVDEVVLVGGQTKMPLVKRMAEQAFPGAAIRDGDVDQAIALGAAMAAKIEMGWSAAELIDVTPFAISLEDARHNRIEIVPAQTRLPHVSRVVCTTDVHGQEAVSFRLYQGDATQLGTFHLDKLRPRNEGQPRIELQLDLDANGFVYAHARDLDSGRSNGAAMELMHGMDRRALARLAERIRKRVITDEVGEQPPEEPPPEEPSADNAAPAETARPLVTLTADGDVQPRDATVDTLIERLVNNEALSDAERWGHLKARLEELGYRVQDERAAPE